MSVYETLDYKQFLRDWVTSRPQNGRGEYRRLAEILGISPTLVSQVVKGDKNFSMEHAVEVADFMGLGERETEQFLLLVEFARAGSHRYRERLRQRIVKAQASAQKLSERLDRDRELSDAESAQYYASWAYTAITHLIACDPHYDVDRLAQRLHLPRASVARILGFLVESRILIGDPTQGYSIGAKHTHIGADSPLVIKHHQNWRLAGFQKMNFASDKELFYTAPMSLSESVADRVRQELPMFIEKLVKWVGPSPSETVRCLNIDWFEY